MKTGTIVIAGLVLCQAVRAQEDPTPETPSTTGSSTAVETVPSIEGKITEVTLYQGTALISREIPLPAGDTGTIEVVVGPLPTATDASSVHAEQGEDVDVRSVTCRTRPTREEERRQNRVQQLDDQIKELERKISNAQNEIALRRIRQDFLRNLGSFVAPAARQEMEHGVIQAEELTKVTQMHFKEYETASQEIMKLDNEVDDNREVLRDLQRERQKLASGPPLAYDAVLYVDKHKEQASTLTLKYLVRDCGWSPVYNMRGRSEDSKVNLDFNAMIHQVSGEDWKNAKLTLSTASPTVSAYNPELTPLYVRVSSGGQQVRENDNAVVYNQAMNAKKAAVQGQLAGKSMNETIDANFKANEFAASLQLIELSERLGQIKLFNRETADDDMSIQYELKKPISLISRRDPQMVPVLSHETDASFYHVAIPILTSSVFRESEIVNDSGRDLLGGRVNVYLDSEFIGRTEIPSIARGRTFTIGFGVDGQLHARRNLADRVETVQGGNRQVALNAQIVIDNYKDDSPVTLRVYERTPYTEDASSLRVALGDMSAPLSKDAEYVRFDKPKGLLRWDLNVPPGRGDGATTVNYGYTLEFDKNLSLEEITREQKSKMRSEFRERATNRIIKRK